MGNSISLRNQNDSIGFNSGLPSSRLQLMFSGFHFSNNTEATKRNKAVNQHGHNVSFSSHFIIAGRRFKNLISQTQTFLFGDQMDLNFILAHKPVAFPYGTPLVEQPSKYLQSLVNIRKDTIKLVKVVDNNSQADDPYKYNIEFRFDCDVDVRIKIYYFANEKFVMTNHSMFESASGLIHQQNLRQLSYVCGCSNYMRSIANKSTANSLRCFCLTDTEGNVYTKGANILFQNQNHFIVPAQFDTKAWQFNINSNYFPIVIECTPVNDHLAVRHAHVTLAYIDKLQSMPVTSSIIPITSTIPENNSNKSINSSSGPNLNTPALYTYQIKPIKQKQLIDGVLYSLQEIYGIEKKISPDFDNYESRLSVSESNTSSSIATQNSNLSTSKSSNLIGSMSKLDINDEPMSCSLKDPILGQQNSCSNNTIEKKRQIDHEIEQEMKGIECVICMCETRDTLILPCRHLCLCKLCAINLRVQSNNCPICRIPFIALIQIKLLKKKKWEEKCQNVCVDNQNPEKNLPIVRIENLPIVKIENVAENTLFEGSNHDNVIIEEAYDIQVEPENRLLCMNSPNFNEKQSLMSGTYEAVTIYEAFNSNQENQFISSNFEENNNKEFNKKPIPKPSKRFKIRILDPIRSSSDFVVQNINEIAVTGNKTSSESTISKLFEIQNISNQIETLGSKPRNHNDLRCSSVVLNKTISDSPEKLYRSSSYIGNFRQLNKLNESIQMEMVLNNTNNTNNSNLNNNQDNRNIEN